MAETKKGRTPKKSAGKKGAQRRKKSQTKAGGNAGGAPRSKPAGQPKPSRAKALAPVLPDVDLSGMENLSGAEKFRAAAERHLGVITKSCIEQLGKKATKGNISVVTALLKFSEGDGKGRRRFVPPVGPSLALLLAREDEWAQSNEKEVDVRSGGREPE